MENILLNIVLLYGAALAGGLAHWLKRWLRGECKCGIRDYLTGEWRSTLLSLVTSLGAATVMISEGQGLDGSPQTLALAFMAGYAADSALNKAPAATT
jgi:hypothetical protein